MTASSLRRQVLLVSAFAAMALGLPAAAGADPSVPGWRNYTRADRIEGAPRPSGDPAVRLISRRGGQSGLDRTLVSPPRRFALRVRGRRVSGRAKLVLEWTDGERVLNTADRTLELENGVAVERFRSPPGADAVRIVVFQEAGSSVLELDSLEISARGGVGLVNEELFLSGCPENNSRPVLPYGTRVVPGWRTTGEETFFQLVQGRSRRSPPLRVFPIEGPGGLSQRVRAPRAAVTVTARGRGASPTATLSAEWTAGRGRGRSVSDVNYPLRLRRGLATVRVAPPRTEGPLRLTLAIYDRRPGVLTLDHVRARAAGRQLLRNPALTVRACAVPPVAPDAVATLRPAVRWPLTGLLLAIGALLLILVARARQRPDTPAVAPEVGRRTHFLLLTAVALVPFVSIGTAKLGIRIIPADWLFVALAAVVLVSPALRRSAFSDRARVVALASAVGLALISAIALVLALRYWSDENLAGLAIRERLVANLGEPASRGGVEELRLLQGVACLFALLALVHTARTWVSVARVVALAGAVVALYGIYQVVGELVLGDVPQPPWAYTTNGRRAGGTFPEPTAFAGFLVFAAACAAAVIELRRSKLMALSLLVIIGGLAASRSTVGLVGMGVLLLALVSLGRLRAAAIVVLPAAALLAVALSLGSPSVSGERWREVYEKPFGVHESLLDREAVWGAAARMGAAYSPTGVGRGQFAYNQAPFVDPEDATRGGRANSALLEWWAESGPLGSLFAAAALMIGPLSLLRRRQGGPSVRRQRTVVWAMCLSLLAVLALYYTTSFVWIWVAIGLLVTAPRALGAGDTDVASALRYLVTLQVIDRPGAERPVDVELHKDLSSGRIVAVDQRSSDELERTPGSGGVGTRHLMSVQVMDPDLRQPVTVELHRDLDSGRVVVPEPSADSDGAGR